MNPNKYIRNAFVAATAALFVGTTVLPAREPSGPINGASVEAVPTAPTATGEVAATTNAALAALSSVVRPLSHPQALATAFRSYFAFKVAHPDQVKKPFLYFVDYGLPSTTPRGYVFNMSSLKVVDGPFAVAHGRGSSTSSTAFRRGSPIGLAAPQHRSGYT
jgi:hypothetical protein